METSDREEEIRRAEKIKKEKEREEKIKKEIEENKDPSNQEEFQKKWGVEVEQKITSFKEELAKIETTQDVVNFDCAKILEILAQCTREQAASITHILRTKLIELKPENINFEADDVNQFMSTPEIWWNSETPEQQLLGLLTLTSFKRSYYKRMISEEIQKAYQEGEGEDKEKFEEKFGDCHLTQEGLIISEEKLKSLEGVFEDKRFLKLKSSFDLILTALRHQKQIKDTQFLGEIAKNPIIINLGGLTFNGKANETEFNELNLQYANFQDCKFSHLDLNKNNFTGANLDRCEFIFTEDRCFWDNNFSDAIICFEKTIKLPPALFDKNDFTGATLKNCDFSKSTDGEIVKTDLKSFTFKGVTLENCYLTGALLPKDFSYAKIIDCKLDQTTINDGDFTEADLSGTTFNGATFKTLLGTTFKNTTMVATDLSGATFAGNVKPTFQNCTLIGTKFPKEKKDESRDWLNKKNIQRQFFKSPKTIEQVASVIKYFQDRPTYIDHELKGIVNQIITAILKNAGNMEILLDMIESLQKINERIDFPIKGETYQVALQKFFSLICSQKQHCFGKEQIALITHYIKAHDDSSGKYQKKYDAERYNNRIWVPKIRQRKQNNQPPSNNKQQGQKPK